MIHYCVYVARSGYAIKDVIAEHYSTTQAIYVFTNIVIGIINNARRAAQRVASQDRPIQLVVRICRGITSLVGERDQIAAIVIAEADQASKSVCDPAHLASDIIRVADRPA